MMGTISEDLGFEILLVEDFTACRTILITNLTLFLISLIMVIHVYLLVT